MSSSSATTKAALGLAALLGALSLSGGAWAQHSGFPTCPTSSRLRWHNCIGTSISSAGNRFVNVYKDDKAEGPGVIYAPNGKILRSGIWENGDFVRSENISPAAIRPSPSSAAAPSPSPPPPPTPSIASSGTAFRIASGQFVTNHHVINSCAALKINGKMGGQVAASDPIKDLALVSIANDQGDSASIRTTRIQLNESITAAGFPLEGAFSGIAITNGTISRLSGLRGDTGEVQISAPVQPGNSGGPLLDTAGNVIGVVSSKLNALKVAGASGDIPQNVNFAINGSSLRAFLDAKNVNYKEAGNEQELTGVQVGEVCLARDFGVAAIAILRAAPGADRSRECCVQS